MDHARLITPATISRLVRDFYLRIVALFAIDSEKILMSY